MNFGDCGGCAGLGSHRRWCPVAVGRGASLIGRYAEQAESLGDSVGANNIAAANLLYAAAGHLYDDARARKEEFQRNLDTQPIPGEGDLRAAE